ncbi:MAG TPA: NAD-dependent epimerase/dehydratase family protein [Streptosporangiaceae bacterium]|nr:NAD-dependent epimerase/dehydratase family protein [Streptosporangiaceae bacterium]
MRILILGGTWFLGRAIAEEATSRGHEVTTFNRGQSGPDTPRTHPVHGDRESLGDLVGLAARGPWDTVIDTSGQVPRTVTASARALAAHADRYVFISTVSVYQGWPVEPLTEESPVLDCPPEAGPDYGENHPQGYPTRYGFQKAGCERAVTSIFPGATVILRPGVILGPHEYIGRLPWWLRRIDRGGTVLAPGDPARPIQPTDVRDVAAFAVAAAAGLNGVFNVTAPPGHTTYGSLLSACQQVTGSDATLMWVSDDFLLHHGVKQWTEIPLWRTYPGTWDVSSDRARAAGLTCRPIRDTVSATWHWLTTDGTTITHHRQAAIGLDPATEQDLLTAWRHSVDDTR